MFKSAYSQIVFAEQHVRPGRLLQCEDSLYRDRNLLNKQITRPQLRARKCTYSNCTGKNFSGFRLRLRVKFSTVKYSRCCRNFFKKGLELPGSVLDTNAFLANKSISIIVPFLV